jgi:hypothetical protein
MVHETIAAGADPNRPDNRGWTPLHFAAQAQSAAVIEALLLAEAHVDAVDSHGNTPLWRAVFTTGMTTRLRPNCCCEPEPISTRRMPTATRLASSPARSPTTVWLPTSLDDCPCTEGGWLVGRRLRLLGRLYSSCGGQSHGWAARSTRLEGPASTPHARRACRSGRPAVARSAGALIQLRLNSAMPLRPELPAR